MPDNGKKQGRGEREHIRLTVQLSLEAYNAVCEIQRRHRASTGRALPAWKVLDAAVKTYARKEGIQSEE